MLYPLYKRKNTHSTIVWINVKLGTAQAEVCGAVPVKGDMVKKWHCRKTSSQKSVPEGTIGSHRYSTWLRQLLFWYTHWFVSWVTLIMGHSTAFSTVGTAHFRRVVVWRFIRPVLKSATWSAEKHLFFHLTGAFLYPCEPKSNATRCK